MGDHRRISIGLLLYGTDQWVGGLYYVLHLAHALSRLPEQQRPEIVIFYRKRVPDYILAEAKTIPHCRLVKVDEGGLLQRAFQRFMSTLMGRNYFHARMMDRNNIDVVYPLLRFDGSLVSRAAVLYWIYDLQHVFLPDHFDQKEIEDRDTNMKRIVEQAENVVVSSEDAKGHLLEKFSSAKAQVHVLHFPSVIKTELPTRESIESKFQIKKPYFMVCNQAWKHKNHMVLLDALQFLREEHDGFEILLTGRMEDPRNPDYAAELKQRIESEAGERIRALGFMERSEQLALMRGALAIIQPSKFEGWGTVVEDAKALGVPVIASNISVHHEQLGNQAMFFAMDDPKELAQLIRQALQGETLPKPPPSLGEDEFAGRFLEIISSVVKDR